MSFQPLTAWELIHSYMYVDESQEIVHDFFYDVLCSLSLTARNPKIPPTLFHKNKILN